MVIDVASRRPVERLQRSGDEAGTAPGDREFRPDVQGLRAVAVALVVLFHAHVPGLGGGYVGVDVFFVISGFVITGVLLRERASTGSTSILSFYGRRIRRILPAATLVIVVAVIASYIVLGPVSGNQMADDARWASVFLINVHFATTGTNYLASQLPPSVLQNYWSLAVEEQFYLIYPTIFLLVAGLSWRLSLRRRLALVLGAAVLVSFVASIVQTSSDPTAAYFSPLPRVWELALGGLVAVSTSTLRRLTPRAAAALSWVGLGSILVAAFAYSSTTPYPGSAVALPVVGAALVIAGGVARPANGAERLLGLRPFQWIGLISYSLYLWHWPVLTLAAEHSSTGTLSMWDSLGWLLLSAGLATLTYLFVENPVRRSRYLVRRRTVTLALGACLIATSLTVATVGIAGHDTGGGLATPGLAGLKTSAACPAPTQQALTPLRGNDPRSADHGVVARVMVVGDSTACTMLPGLEAAASPAGVQIEDGAVIGCGVVSGEIAPDVVDGVNFNAGSRLCQSKANAAEQSALRSGTPNVIVWASAWERLSLVVRTDGHQKVLDSGSPQWYSVVRQRMEARLRLLTATGATVVMLTQAPFVPIGSATDSPSQDEDFTRLNSLMRSVAADTPHVRVIDLASRICPSGPPCSLVVDHVFLRGDGTHYTGAGSLWVARWLLPQLGIPALERQTNPLPIMTVAGVSNGAVISGTHLVAAQESFNFGIEKVDFEVSGPGVHDEVIGKSVLSPHGYWYTNWNTEALPDGTYVIRCVAYNSAGARSTSKGVTVRVAN